METCASFRPADVGAKLTLITQLAPAASGPPLSGQVVVAGTSLKSGTLEPARKILEMFNATLPVLVTVMFCAGLLVPTA